MQPEELTEEAIDYIVDRLCDELAKDRPSLNDWERNFVISVEDQWRRNRSLSERQKEILGKIWDKQS